MHIFGHSHPVFHSSLLGKIMPRQSDTQILWCTTYICMHWIGNWRTLTPCLSLSLMFSGCFPPGRLHKWHCVLWRFYLTVVAWRERDVLSHSDPTTQIGDKEQNRVLWTQTESGERTTQPYYLKLEETERYSIYLVYHYLLLTSYPTTKRLCCL